MTVGPYFGSKVNRRPSFKGRMMVDVLNGKMRVRAWPRKRGKSRSAITKEQNERFRQAQQLTKYLDPEEMKIAMEATHRTPLMPRDILTMIFYNRAWMLSFDDGRVLYTVAQRTDVSDSLDVISREPGAMLIRGEDFWEATPVSGSAGNGVGYLLTLDFEAVPWVDIPLAPGSSMAELSAIIRPSTNGANLLARVTTNNFVTIESGSGTYAWNEARAFPSNSLTNTSNNSNNEMRLASNLGSAADRQLMGTIRVIAPGDPDQPTEFLCDHGRLNNSGEYNRAFGGGRYKPAASVDGVRLYASSGNLTGRIDSYVFVRTVEA